MEKGKFVIDVKGNVEPLFATIKQWDTISLELKKGPLEIHTASGSRNIFAVLEVCKGYQGKGISREDGNVIMIFGEV